MLNLGMHYQTTLFYYKSLIKRAVFSFWWRVVGVKFLIALSLVAFGLVQGYRAGNQSWVMGVLVTVLSFGIAFMVALYVIHYQGAINRFKAMGQPSAKITLSNDACTFVSGAGSTTIAWSAILELWQFADYWLLFYSKAQFSILPTANLSPAMQSFMVEKITQAGGKISA